MSALAKYFIPKGAPIDLAYLSFDRDKVPDQSVKYAEFVPFFDVLEIAHLRKSGFAKLTGLPSVKPRFLWALMALDDIAPGTALDESMFNPVLSMQICLTKDSVLGFDLPAQALTTRTIIPRGRLLTAKLITGLKQNDG